jgi:oligopeptide transport system substrate-binding protein
MPALMSACSPAGADARYFGKAEPPQGQVLRYVSGSEPESLDPHLSTGQPEGRIEMALFEGLTEYDPKTAEPIPAIAERWEISANNTEFVFHLRRNARWSDGTPITAGDFVYSFRRGLSPELAARAAYLAYDIEYGQAFNEGGAFVRDPATGRWLDDPDNRGTRLVVPAEPKARAKIVAASPALRSLTNTAFVPVRGEDIGVDAIDDHTVRIRLSRPAPFFLGLLANQFFRAVPRGAIEAHGTAWTRPEHIVTSGPFLMTSWKPYDSLVVVKNPWYWDTVGLDQITFYPVEEITTMMNLFKAGEIDATLNRTVPPAWVDQMRHYVDYMDAPEVGTEYYLVNVTRPPMNDARVRRAFNMAIDKVALAEFKRTAKPLNNVVPDGIFPGYPSPGGAAFDPSRARALLAEAGYQGAGGDFDPATFPVSSVAITYNTLESVRQTAEFVQAQWKQHLGLTVLLKNMEFKTVLSVRSRLEYDGFARGGWVGDYVDPFTFLSLFTTAGGDNGTGWTDPEFIRMLEEANRQSDRAARYQGLARAEAFFLDAQPIIPLYTTATNWLKKPYVKGMYPNPVTMHAWKYVRIEHDPAKWGER